MRKYIEMMKSQIKLNVQYSAWYWSFTFSNLLKLLVAYTFWHAVYANRSTVDAMPLDTMLTYIVVAMLLGNFMVGYGNQLAQSVRDGSVGIELMRPYDLLNKIVAIDLGQKLTGIIRDALPMAVVAFLFLGIRLPVSWEAGLWFLLASAIGILIASFLDLVIGILAFWLEYIWGLSVLRNAIMLFFTGAIAPISMFPEWLQKVSVFLPFQSMVYVPVSIYTGQLQGAAMLEAIAIQLFWLIVVVAAIRFYWAYALRRVTIFGG